MPPARPLRSCSPPARTSGRSSPSRTTSPTGGRGSPGSSPTGAGSRPVRAGRSSAAAHRPSCAARASGTCCSSTRSSRPRACGSGSTAGGSTSSSASTRRGPAARGAPAGDGALAGEPRPLVPRHALTRLHDLVQTGARLATLRGHVRPPLPRRVARGRLHRARSSGSSSASASRRATLVQLRAQAPNEPKAELQAERNAVVAQRTRSRTSSGGLAPFSSVAYPCLMATASRASASGSSSSARAIRACAAGVEAALTDADGRLDALPLAEGAGRPVAIGRRSRRAGARGQVRGAGRAEKLGKELGAGAGEGREDPALGTALAACSSRSGVGGARRPLDGVVLVRSASAAARARRSASSQVSTRGLGSAGVPVVAVETGPQQISRVPVSAARLSTVDDLRHRPGRLALVAAAGRRGAGPLRRRPDDDAGVLPVLPPIPRRLEAGAAHRPRRRARRGGEDRAPPSRRSGRRSRTPR